MNRAWAEIERLIEVGAIHRKGFNIRDVKPNFIMGQALNEFEELFWGPDNPEEMADLLGVLYHYCIKKGWSMQFIEELMLNKFSRRFTCPE